MNRFMKTLFFALSVMLTALSFQAMGAQPCAFSDEMINTRPNLEKGPTELNVEWFLFDLVDINTVEQTYTVDFFIELWWKDERVVSALNQAGLDKCEAGYDGVWRPKMFSLNAVKLDQSLPEVYYAFADGTVRGEQRITGTFRAKFNLNEFPLDIQQLPMEFVTTNYKANELKFNYNGDGFDPNLSVAGWRLDDLEGQSGRYQMAIQSQKQTSIEGLAYFQFMIDVTREFDFYFWKVILPMSLMVLISWVVFWIDSKHFSVQATLSNGMLLSIVAFLFSLQLILPKTSYLTKMDIFVYTSLLFVFFALMQSVTTCIIGSNGKADLAKKMDKVSRVLFPALFIGINVLIWFGP